MTENFGLTNSRLSARVAAAVGGTALSLASCFSTAAIIDSGLLNTPIPNTTFGIYYNVVTNASSTAAPVPVGWDFNPWGSGGNLAFFSSSAVGNNNQVVGTGGAQLLAAGDVVGPASAFNAAGTVTAVAFRITGTPFVGFRFTNEATSVINFGYAQLSTTAGTGFPATVIRYVYQNDGTAITIPGGGGGNTAPTLAYTPMTAAGVTFPAGAAGAATSTIAIAATGAAGTGATVLSGCAVTGAGAASFGAPTTTPANGTFNTGTTAGSINLGCTRGAAAATASLACTETSTPGAAATRTWALTCPAATAAATVTPGTVSGTASPLPSYNLPTGSSSRGFVFTTAGAGTTLTCAISGAKGFVVSPASSVLAIGVPATVTVTFTGTTVGTVNGTLTCNTTGNAQTFTYPISVVVGPAGQPVLATQVPSLSLMGNLLLLAGLLGMGMVMVGANRRV